MLFTARVHGHGLVDWTPEKVDAHAAELLATHQQGRRLHRSARCRRCDELWPCSSVAWADRWQRRAADTPGAARR
ncbi:hypothetical protein SAMN04488563_5416 [Jiangella alkaliphila]|uniref:Uncharacterized protein n=1 Tax=Jiangella alkaliphila TaxID=419479 RepID=A0A1H2L941_9ACTN|nr:hypothetical protein SAMN04488563_5416 [Jiangella alkaliphila]